VHDPAGAGRAVSKFGVDAGAWQMKVYSGRQARLARAVLFTLAAICSWLLVK
jgi:hypothetical protein